MEIALSVIIPTHNRADDLFENLDLLLPQCEGKPVEVIVVDSASDPSHAAAIRRSKGAGNVQLIRVDRPGLSIARNTGTIRARGAWLGFLDDDVLPAPHWVDAALGSIQSMHDKVGIIAGRVLPRWPSEVRERSFEPSRLGRRSLILLSVIEDASVYCSSASPIGIGANLLIRKSALHRMGGFSEDMGRVRDTLASGEDAFVIEGVVKYGFETWYDGSICVEHKIYERQLTRRWMARRAWHEGFVSLRRNESNRQRFLMTAKCVASLPVLAILRAFAQPTSEYIVRLHHNTGFAYGALTSMLRRGQRETDTSPASVPAV